MFPQGLIIIAVLVAAIAAQSPLTVNTPASAQACLPVQLSWGGGSPPYYVSIIPGGQPGSAALHDFGQQESTSLTWNVDQPASTSLTVQIRDKSGALNYSDKFIVQPSTATCTTESGSGNSSSSNAPKGAPAPSSPAKPAGSNSSSTLTPATTGSTNSSASPANTAATAAPASGASRNLPGFLALGLAAVFAVLA